MPAACFFASKTALTYPGFDKDSPSHENWMPGESDQKKHGLGTYKCSCKALFFSAGPCWK
ncbi:hypothetical protein B0A63_08575 [Flavobacterium johnsoniae UW101]|nr:hypothetical protein B0A63_08575 [Flavobacterium johnsoniae UW101]